MPAYQYIAINNKGKRIKGAIQADTEKQARTALREKSLTPLKINAVAEKNTPKKVASFFNKTLSTYDLSLTTRQISAMLLAGLPIDESLSAAAEQTEKRSVRALLLSIKSHVMEGMSLAKAMEEYPTAFSSMYCSTIAAGEKAGHLGEVMSRLADHTEESAEFKQNVVTAMVYPIILIVVSVIIVTGLMIYVVPDVIKVFTDTGQELPFLTKGLMGISHFLQTSGGWFALVLMCISLSFFHFVRKPQVQQKLHRFYLKIPIIKKLFRNFNSARYISTLHILTSSGVPLLEAMEISGKIVPNVEIKKMLLNAAIKVKEGASLSKALGQIPHFPPVVIHLIASGEASGELDQMLNRAAKNQEKELERWVTMATSLIEPATLLIMGFIVMLIVLAILLPILNMNQLIV